MIYLQGDMALSTYRCDKLLSKLKKIAKQVTSLEVFYSYFIQTPGELTQAQHLQLITLLGHAVEVQPTKARQDFLCWVVPRLGTISPWSTKATDIAHTCGLQAVVRIERGRCYRLSCVGEQEQHAITRLLHDPLTESVITDFSDLVKLFATHVPREPTLIPFIEQGDLALEEANHALGLALSETDLDYLSQSYTRLKRNPTEAELMMFAQVNSEHCRHKIFNAAWTIDEIKKPHSLFSMIKNTYQQYPDQILSAYKDNAAVILGNEVPRFLINPNTKIYEYHLEETPFVLKVETHNHPTGISPFAGAATGSGGEIRDEAATGRGAQTKAGVCGFTVSDLNVPGFGQPWETCIGKPASMASPLEIMIEGPLGAATFNNEFGRPNIAGYFRTCQFVLMSQYGEICRGFHKPIMIAGGLGQIRPQDVVKKNLTEDTLIIVLGGPALAIGLGGGSASSRATAQGQDHLDFASVQRANPEMQRRAQEVLNTCVALGHQNPILSVHDVGAGGLSNAVPELVNDSGLGGEFELRWIPTAEPGMSPMEIWCNESQERFVLGISQNSLDLFNEIAKRERCPFAVIGKAKTKQILTVHDEHFKVSPVDLPMSVLFEDMPKTQRKDVHTAPADDGFDTSKIDIADAIKRVLQFPCVSSKSFLITIGDRSVGGLVARDQCVGPWQVPVADCGVTLSSFSGYAGEAIAMGERSPIALLHHAASARMAVGEAITNLAASAVEDLSDVVLSANWMAAADYPGEGAGLYDAVLTVAMELCPSLNVVIPVGKDSLSMRTTWEQSGQTRSVTSPLSLIVTAAARVTDVRRTLTPVLSTSSGATTLILIDLSKGANLLGASALAQVYNSLGKRPPDVDDPQLLRHFFKVIQSMNRHGLLLAYHDRSDGGLLATVCEMMFAGHTGVTLKLDHGGDDPLAALFAEELGAVIQVQRDQLDTVLSMLEGHGLAKYAHVIGEPNRSDTLEIFYKGAIYYKNSRCQLQKYWAQTSYEIQRLRDHSVCADSEFAQLDKAENKGLTVNVPFQLTPAVDAHMSVASKPRVAILREQGVNGHVEMAAAFMHAGFESVDVHMSDLIANRVTLSDFQGVAACGGFSYGDVLGAGRGWAQSILMHSRVSQQFQEFFARPETFTLGVCNGCQMLAHLRDLIPGAIHWPSFLPNVSEQFEARLSLVEIPSSPSIFLKGMAGAVLPVVVSHGEGRVEFNSKSDLDTVKSQKLISMRYVDPQHQPTIEYPHNPNGSPLGITALTTPDGRVTIMMPHPERVFRTVQLSWHPREWQEDSPWAQMFYNARRFV